MALAYLQIFFIVLIALGAIGQFLLYKDTGKIANKNTVFIFNTLFAILLSWLIYSSLPENYHTEKIISLIWGFLALAALVFKLIKKNNILISKLLLTISIVGGMIHLFL